MSFSSIRPLWPTPFNSNLYSDKENFGDNFYQPPPHFSLLPSNPLLPTESHQNALFFKPESLSSPKKKRSFKHLQEHDPFSFLQQRDYYSITSKSKELCFRITEAKTLNEIFHIIHTWEYMEDPEKESIKEEFEKNLIGKLTLLNKMLISLEVSTYEDLKKTRAGISALNLLDKRYGTYVLKNGDLLNNTITPFKRILESKISTLHSTEKGVALLFAEKLTARKIGQKTRDITVTTSQMYSLLKDRIPEINHSDLVDISRALSRQINEMTENLELYLGKSHKLHANTKSFSFYCLEAGETKNLTLNFDCWFQILEEETEIGKKETKEIEIFIVPKDLPPNQGALKTVSNAYSFKFPLKVQPRQESRDTLKSLSRNFKREGVYSPVVLQEINKKDLKKIERGIALQKKLKNLAPHVNFVALPKQLTPSTSESSDQSVVFSQEWYNCDLLDACFESEVPLSFHKHRTLKLSLLDTLKSLKDVGIALIICHQAGIVHRDVKPDNLLLKASEGAAPNRTIQGFLSDYDLAQTVGPVELHHAPYCYWDTLSHKGLATPFTDVYGLALSLIETVFPNFNSRDVEKISEDKNLENEIIFDEIRTFLPEIDSKKGSKANKIKYYEGRLEKAISTTAGLEQKHNRAILAKIRALKGVMSLFVSVIKNDKELSFIPVNKGPLWRSIDDLGSRINSEKRSKVILDVLEQFSGFYKQFDSISHWNMLSNQLKVKEIKSHLKYLEKLKTIGKLDPSILFDPSKIISEIQLSENVMEFLSGMDYLSPQEKLQHPLYNYLKNPMELNPSDESINQCINEEIKKIYFSPNSYPETSAQKAFKDFNEGNKERSEFKMLLLTIMHDQTQPEIFRIESQNIYNKIIIIENCMLYVTLMHSSFQKSISEIKEKAMTMEGFVATLSGIITELEAV